MLLPLPSLTELIKLIQLNAGAEKSRRKKVVESLFLVEENKALVLPPAFFPLVFVGILTEWLDINRTQPWPRHHAAEPYAQPHRSYL